MALQTFPAFAASQGIDVGSVSIEPTDLPKSELIEKMLNEDGDVAAMFGYVTTISAAARGIGIDPARLRFINYRDALPDFYGSALMVSRDFHSNHHDVVASVVRAINRGVMLTVQDPAAGISALVKRAPDVGRATELERLIGTLSGEMSHPETSELGYGDANDERLTAAIALLCRSKGLARIPATNEIFTRQFLPPASKRTPV